MSYYNGKGGTCVVTGGTLPVIDWEFDRVNNIATVTSAISPASGYSTVAAAAEKIPGPVNEAKGTANVMWASTATPESVGIYEGASTNMTLNFGTSGKSYTFTAIVASLKPKVSSREGAIQYSISFESSGAITVV